MPKGKTKRLAVKSIYLRYRPFTLEGDVLEALKEKNKKTLNSKLTNLVYQFGVTEVGSSLTNQSECFTLEKRDELYHESLRYFKEIVALTEYKIDLLRQEKFAQENQPTILN